MDIAKKISERQYDNATFRDMGLLKILWQGRSDISKIIMSPLTLWRHPPSSKGMQRKLGLPLATLDQGSNPIHLCNIKRPTLQQIVS